MKSLKDLCPLWSSIMLCNLVFLFLPPPSSSLPVRPKIHFFINTVRRWWNCLPSRRNRKFRKQSMDRRLLRRSQGMRKRRTELRGKWNSWKQSRNNRMIIPRETWGRLLSLGTKRTTCRWEQTSHYHRGRGRFRDGEGHKGVIHQHIDCHLCWDVICFEYIWLCGMLGTRCTRFPTKWPPQDSNLGPSLKA